jgi:hypothetical protein
MCMGAWLPSSSVSASPAAYEEKPHQTHRKQHNDGRKTALLTMVNRVPMLTSDGASQAVATPESA